MAENGAYAGKYMKRFVFDLDGTLTKAETLPLIAKHFALEHEIEELTRQTVQGKISFEESFAYRVSLLGKYPVSEISDLLGQAVLFEKLCRFIGDNSGQCVIATGNLLCWADKLVRKIGCRAYCSEALTENNKVKKLEKILQKESVVEYYKKQGDYVIFVGDGSNDEKAMRCADLSVACGLVHTPAETVLSIADYAVFDEESLYCLLNGLK